MVQVKPFCFAFHSFKAGNVACGAEIWDQAELMADVGLMPVIAIDDGSNTSYDMRVPGGNKPKIVQVYGDAKNSDDDDDGGTAGATTSSYVQRGARRAAPAECIPRGWSSRRR